MIKFVNIADPNYKPKNHMGISYEEAMETIHAIRPDGSVSGIRWVMGKCKQNWISDG